MEDKHDYTALPQTVEAACNKLMSHLTQVEIDSLATIDDLSDLHFSLGLYIRNQFRPYMNENENLIRDCLKYAGIDVVGDNVITKSILAQYQGDEASSIILQALKDKIRQRGLNER